MSRGRVGGRLVGASSIETGPGVKGDAEGDASLGVSLATVTKPVELLLRLSATVRVYLALVDSRTVLYNTLWGSSSGPESSVYGKVRLRGVEISSIKIRDGSGMCLCLVIRKSVGGGPRVRYVDFLMCSGSTQPMVHDSGQGGVVGMARAATEMHRTKWCQVAVKPVPVCSPGMPRHLVGWRSVVSRRHVSLNAPSLPQAILFAKIGALISA